MNPLEANVVLALAGRFDGRKPDAETAIEWAKVLSGLLLDDCLAAVRAHYAVNRKWIMPADIRERVNTVRNDRVERGKPFLVPPPELDQLDGEAHRIAYQDWLAGKSRQLADGQAPKPNELPSALPPPEVRRQLDALRPRPTELDADENRVDQ